MNKTKGIYNVVIKRILDFTIALCALLVLSPFLLIFMIIGYFKMKGNPFFVQLRPGRNEKIFKLIKFRSMSNEKDENGELLPDHIRLNAYGKFLRKTSIDELPELINILLGDMSIVGPRPLAVCYLPYYNEKEKLRHSVRPGLTGLAQVNGRNTVNWPERLGYDITYVETISFLTDVKIILKTIQTVFCKSDDIVVRGTGEIVDFDQFRINELKQQEGLKK